MNDWNYFILNIAQPVLWWALNELAVNNAYHLRIIRFKQTRFVSTRLDITRSPLSVFARCLILLAVCFPRCLFFVT